MDTLLLKETKGTPGVKMYPNGEIFIEGRSLPEDPVKFYTPVLNWTKNCKAESVKIDIRLEYMNTSSSKEVYTFFSLLKGNENVKNISVVWHYEEGDEDGHNVGREFEAITKLPFHFQEYAEA
jgi:hypothetical protein